MKKTIGFSLLFLALTACGQSASKSVDIESSQNASSPADKKAVTELVWEDLMPEGEDALLAELYSDFFEELEKKNRPQISLADAAREADLEGTDLNASLADIAEGSAQDTMEQIGTFNVVDDLNGLKVRMPGYIVPLDFDVKSEHDEFLLVPYFGACLHTPPPPPNQIVYVKASPATIIEDINEPFWIEGTMKTGKFTSELGNSAYELDLSKLEPYEYEQ